MKHKVIRSALVVAEAFVGIWAVIGGVALVKSKWGNALPMAAVQQTIIFVLGLATFGLAAYLWRTEYRGHSLLNRHASHA